MTYAELLRQRIEDNLHAARTNSSDDVSGISPELVTLIFNLVLSLIEGCRSKNDDNAVADAITSPGLIQRWVVLRAVKKSDIPRDDHELSNSVITKTLNQSNTREEVVGLFQEMDSATPDWSLF